MFSSYQNHNFQKYDLGHTVVRLRSDLGIQQTHLLFVEHWSQALAGNKVWPNCYVGT